MSKLVMAYAVFACLMNWSSATAQFPQASSFDSGLDGWIEDTSPMACNQVSWQSSGGNPSGMLRFDDIHIPPAGCTGSIVAPARYLGDWTSLDASGTIRYEQRLLTVPGGSCSLIPATIRITGALGDVAVWNGPTVPADGAWHSITATVSEADWAVTGDWNQLLSSVVRFRIQTELVNNFGPCPNNEVTGTDNIVVAASPWSDLGGGTIGAAGTPLLVGSGSLSGGTLASVQLTNAPGNALMVAWISFAPTPFMAVGGTVHAFPFANQFLLFADGTGVGSLSATWPAGVAAGTNVWFQFLVQDGSSSHGITLSNGLLATTP